MAPRRRGTRIYCTGANACPGPSQPYRAPQPHRHLEGARRDNVGKAEDEPVLTAPGVGIPPGQGHWCQAVGGSGRQPATCNLRIPDMDQPIRSFLALLDRPLAAYCSRRLTPKQRRPARQVRLASDRPQRITCMRLSHVTIMALMVGIGVPSIGLVQDGAAVHGQGANGTSHKRANVLDRKSVV